MTATDGIINTHGAGKLTGFSSAEAELARRFALLPQFGAELMFPNDVVRRLTGMHMAQPYILK